MVCVVVIMPNTKALMAFARVGRQLRSWKTKAAISNNGSAATTINSTYAIRNQDLVGDTWMVFACLRLL